MTDILVDGILRPMTVEEQADFDAKQALAVDPGRLESLVQQAAGDFTGRSDSDKALAMLIADLWLFLNTGIPNPDPAMTPQEARDAVRARFVEHMRTLKGL